ncbi:MAG: hypothetical protein JNM27_10565 [Leptospirales bacterium]|nr:hypothetical protein [Leptospirales bacterium]
MKTRIGLILILTSILPLTADGPEIAAQLGLEIRGQASRRAKARDSIKVNERVIAYAMPSQECFQYVILTAAGKSRLLNPGKEKGFKDEAEAFPSLEQGWTPGAAGPAEITFIISKSPIAELAPLKNGTSADDWRKIEEKLREKARINDAAGKPIPIAANVRSLGAAAFARQLPKYSGSGIIAARFHLDVQN